MKPYQRQDSQNIEFWQARLKQFDNPLKAIGCGFDWEKIDDVHKKIVYPHYTKGMKVLVYGITYKPNIMPVKGEVTRAVYVSTNDPDNKELTFSVKAYVE